VRKLR